MDALIRNITITFTTVSVAVALAIAVYHWILMIVAACSQPSQAPAKSDPAHSFAIVIPAHDEEAMLAHTLDSCEALDYPESKRAVYVIADNCSDRTAALARARGAHCLVRSDPEHRGKGFALAWALPQIVDAGHDAVLVLDADCQIDSHALKAFDERLARGARVLQANDVVANPDASATSYLLAVANLLENDCFYAPKSQLGLAVFLRGTGMVFHRDILRRFPWQADSLVEDVEYTCQLIEAGQRVHFVRTVRVESDFPVGRDQLTVQRSRWVGGGLQMAAARAPRLIRQCLKTGRPALLDAAVTMLMTSRPVIIGQVFVTGTLAAWCHWLWPNAWTSLLVAASLVVAAGYVVYAALGVALLGLSLRRLELLLRLPISLVAYLYVAVRGFARGNASGWRRTPRIDYPPEAGPLTGGRNRC
ncbi:MAG: glycosyltransferase family 2 protein [Thermoguttaceae bacterium]